MRAEETAHPYNTERKARKVMGRTSPGEAAARASAWKPVLGLSTRPVRAAAGPAAARPRSLTSRSRKKLMELTVIVPARNEEDCLGACLESLAASRRRSSSWAATGS